MKVFCNQRRRALPLDVGKEDDVAEFATQGGQPVHVVVGITVKVDLIDARRCAGSGSSRRTDVVVAAIITLFFPLVTTVTDVVVGAVVQEIRGNCDLGPVVETVDVTGNENSEQAEPPPSRAERG